MTRIAIDIDSTLHHYWDLLEELARWRHGIELPYAEQTGWGIEALEPDQVRALVAETHADEHILAAEPYPHATKIVTRWHRQGHWIQITSHRAETARDATERWLRRVGISYDDLHCSFDKVTRCVELEVDVLIDDSPVNLARARAHGMRAATIIHPWNAGLVERDGVIGGRDWLELARRLEPLLASP